MAAWALAVAACGVVPRPFSHDGTVSNPIAQPGPRAGIAVLPVRGAGQGAELAEALAAALRGQDLAAHSARERANGYVVQGVVRDAPGSDEGRGAVAIVWAVSDPKGRPAGVHLQKGEVDGAAWRDGDAALLARLAAGAVPGIVPFITEIEAPPPSLRPTVARPDVTGAPGDGRISLRRAIAFELEKAGLRVSEADSSPEGALVLAGTVTSAPAGNDQERIAITWTLLDSRGEVLGTLSQGNQVPKGSLDPEWGITAALVARAAAPGLVKLIDRRATGPAEGR